MEIHELKSAANISFSDAQRWLPCLIATFNEFKINTPEQRAMFIAQVGHESNSFSAISESFNYSIKGLKNTFRKRLSDYQCELLGRQNGEPFVPENRQIAIANIVYDGRLGNKCRGDGWKYRGRGLIQITGRENYKMCGSALNVDLIAEPEKLEDMWLAMRSAGWYWHSRNCNLYCHDMEKVTRLINGGLNGIEDRKKRFNLAIKKLINNPNGAKNE